MIKKSEAISNKEKLEIISAVISYHNLHSTNVSDIASLFGKTENEITKWFCKAIANSYVADDNICKKVANKHITEYENRHNISNSSLRIMYNEAFKIREFHM